MLSHQQRLAKEQDIRYVLGRGNIVPGKFFLLRNTASRDNMFRAGFVVSKKVSPRAVVRNLVKRRMREAVRATHHTAQKPSWCVFIAKRSAVHASFSDLRNDIGAVFKKLS
ncbi:MAG: ribonuclease P protein component [Patescibacteria group bacterium]